MQKLMKNRLVVATVFIVILIPAILYFGVLMGDRNYAITSTAIMILSILPFILLYEKKRSGLRELVILAVMCAIGVAGRSAFAMIPQFKPILAVIIIAAIAFGSEAGFLCGAMTMLLSNFMLGQGPWTPWQMFACGMIGFVTGLAARKGIFQNKYIMCLWGLAAGYVYGFFVDIWPVLALGDGITLQAVLVKFLFGIWFTTIFAVATAFFLFIMGKPMIEKLNRVKTKYKIL